MENHLSPLQPEYPSPCNFTWEIPFCRHRPIFIIRLRVYFAVYSVDAIVSKVLIRTSTSGRHTASFAGNDPATVREGFTSVCSRTWFVTSPFCSIHKRTLRANKHISSCANITWRHLEISLRNPYVLYGSALLIQLSRSICEKHASSRSFSLREKCTIHFRNDLYKWPRGMSELAVNRDTVSD